MHSSPQLLQLSRQNILLGSLINVCFLLPEAAAYNSIFSTHKANIRLHLTLRVPQYFYGKDNMNSLALPRCAWPWELSSESCRKDRERWSDLTNIPAPLLPVMCWSLHYRDWLSRSEALGLLDMTPAAVALIFDLCILYLPLNFYSHGNCN